MIIEYRSLTINDVNQMSKLLIKRQVDETFKYTFLRTTDLSETNVIKRLTKIFTSNQVIGIGAFLGDQLIGYLFGIILSNSLNGKVVSVPYEGLVIQSNQDKELIRKLYKKVSLLWIKQGCYKHSITIPLGSMVYYDALVNLSFAIEQVYGILDLFEYNQLETSSDIIVRFANKNDKNALVDMSDIIALHQNDSPVYIYTPNDYLLALQQGFSKLVEEDDIVFLAESNNDILGYQVFEEVKSTLMIPDGTVVLNVAATKPSQAGKGVGKALMNFSYKYFKSRNFKYVLTDWRISNLMASTFWPKCGFVPFAYRMIRVIDPQWKRIS